MNSSLVQLTLNRKTMAALAYSSLICHLKYFELYYHKTCRKHSQGQTINRTHYVSLNDSIYKPMMAAVTFTAIVSISRET